MVTIAAEGLRVRLGRRGVIDGVDVAFGGGALVGVVGPNGAGKSTLVRALLGLVPAQGRIAIDGTPLTALSRAAIARRVAYLPQGQVLHWPLSVERLVTLGRLPHLAPFSGVGEGDRRAVAAAMARADVTALADRTATELSGGERARVLLARALAVGAPALVVDEPLAALDPAHQIAVMEILRAEADAGGLVIAVLHDLGLAMRHCDRLVMLDGGRVVADGAPRAVLTPDRLRATYGVEAWFGEVAGEPAIVPVRRA